MDIQLFSFVFAVVLGIVCFGLVKYTADEFDRWYEGTGEAISLKVPAVVGTLATFLVAAVFLLAR
jgi:hypothetical protein